MTAVINGAASFRRVMHRAEILPFGRSHFGACLGGAGGLVGEERNNQIVDFHGQETAEFV